MKESYFLKFFGKKKKKKDFFADFWKEFLQILRDLLLLYRNFFHWNISKIIINIVALWVGILLALPLFLFAVFIALIDPIPWTYFIQLQVQWVNPLLEALSYATLHTFSFVVMTIVMILTLTLFLVWNAYSNVLLTRLYESYLDKKRLYFTDNFYFSIPHIKKFTSIALWHGVILFIPLLIIWTLTLILVVLNWGEIISFEIFSISLLIIVLWSVFIFSYILYRVLFSVIYLSFDSSEKVEKHTGWHYIKKSYKITSWFQKYIKFLFILAFLFLLTHPFRIVGNSLQNDISRLQDTIEFRTLSIANPEAALDSPLREVALFYENLSDERLFANYRWATILSIFLSVIWFLLISGLYTMAFVSFHRRILS